MPVPKPDQFQRLFFISPTPVCRNTVCRNTVCHNTVCVTVLDGSGAGERSVALNSIDCMSAHEYSNSRPQFKQAWYVRFLIVSTARHWR
jgi:hypothetical protein